MRTVASGGFGCFFVGAFLVTALACGGGDVLPNSTGVGDLSVASGSAGDSSSYEVALAGLGWPEAGCEFEFGETRCVALGEDSALRVYVDSDGTTVQVELEAPAEALATLVIGSGTMASLDRSGVQSRVEAAGWSVDTWNETTDADDGELHILGTLSHGTETAELDVAIEDMDALGEIQGGPSEGAVWLGQGDNLLQLTVLDGAAASALQAALERIE
jgi:hypothetical protein